MRKFRLALVAVVASILIAGSLVAISETLNRPETVAIDINGEGCGGGCASEAGSCAMGGEVKESSGCSLESAGEAASECKGTDKCDGDCDDCKGKDGCEKCAAKNDCDGECEECVCPKDKKADCDGECDECDCPKKTECDQDCAKADCDGDCEECVCPKDKKADCDGECDTCELDCEVKS